MAKKAIKTYWKIVYRHRRKPDGRWLPGAGVFCSVTGREGATCNYQNTDEVEYTFDSITEITEAAYHEWFNEWAESKAKRTQQQQRYV